MAGGKERERGKEGETDNQPTKSCPGGRELREGAGEQTHERKCKSREQASRGRAAGRKAASCARPCMKLKWEGRRKEARKTARSCVKPRKYHERAENIHTPPTV